MEKALPWIIGILALLVLFACIQVGWLYSILTIGIVCGVIYSIHLLHKKAWQPGASGRIINIAKVSKTIVIVISACLIFVGIVLGGVGLLNPETDGYYSQVCGYCGGSGRLTSGKTCGLCDGWGGAISENLVFDKHTWIGILMAASGAVMLLCAKDCLMPSAQPKGLVYSNNKYADTIIAAEEANPKRIPDIKFEPLNTKVADFTMMLGHWKEKDTTPKTWISNEADAAGVWTMRCRISNKGEKTINDLSLTVSLYNSEGKPVSEHKIYHAARIIKSREIHSLWWNPPCPNTTFAKGVLESVEIHFTDGTTRSFSRF